MAKKKSKKSYRRKNGIFTGKLGKILKGGAVGFGINFVPNLPVVGGYTRPAILVGGGWVLKDNDLMTMGAYELGRMFGQSNAGNSGGFWEA